MKEISISKGQIALVDDRDFKKVNQYKWKAAKTPKQKYYCAARTDKKGGGMRCMYMHRYILNINDKQVVVHKNGNRLDNRRKNLEITTKGATVQGRKKENKKYIGVRIAKRNYRLKNKWVATIKVNYKNLNLGYYKTEKQAARAYDIAAKLYFGKHANLNFPREVKEYKKKHYNLYLKIMLLLRAFIALIVNGKKRSG